MRNAASRIYTCMNINGQFLFPLIAIATRGCGSTMKNDIEHGTEIYIFKKSSLTRKPNATRILIKFNEFVKMTLAFYFIKCKRRRDLVLRNFSHFS